MMDRYATYGSTGGNPWIKRGIAAAVLLGFAGLLVFATLGGPSVDENVNPPLISAPDGSIKERPENPGGMDVPNRDKAVFDLLDVNGGTAVPTPNQAQVDAAQVPAQAIATGATVVVAEAKPAPVVVAKPAPVKAASVVSGPWAVQLGSFRKEVDAEKAAKTYQGKFSTLLHGLNSVVKSADLGDKGVVYRVYFKGLESQADARTLCNKFKAQNQGCLTAQL